MHIRIGALLAVLLPPPLVASTLLLIVVAVVIVIVVVVVIVIVMIVFAHLWRGRRHILIAVRRIATIAFAGRIEMLA